VGREPGRERVGFAPGWSKFCFAMVLKLGTGGGEEVGSRNEPRWCGRGGGRGGPGQSFDPETTVTRREEREGTGEPCARVCPCDIGPSGKSKKKKRL
jgi:hypothetical protein